MVFVLPFMTVVIARSKVVRANTSPMSIIVPIILLAKSFMLKDICVMEEKQKEANRIKNTRVFLLFVVLLFRSSRKEPSLPFISLYSLALEVLRPSRKSVSTGFFSLYQA